MVLKNSTILEKVADLLSELNFNDEDLQKMCSLVTKILEIKKLEEILNDPSNDDTIQRFCLLLLKDIQFLDYLQDRTLEKIRANFKKKSALTYSR